MKTNCIHVPRTAIAKLSNVVTISPGPLRILLSISLSPVETHEVHRFGQTLALEPSLLASASNDRTVKLWDAGSGAVCQTLEVDVVVRTLSFSDDGIFLQTNRGLLHTAFHPDSAIISRPNLPRCVFVKELWVSWGMKIFFGFLPSIDQATSLFTGVLLVLVICPDELRLWSLLSE